MSSRRRRLHRRVAISCAVLLGGCAAHEGIPAGSVSRAWWQRQRTGAQPTRAYRRDPVADRSNGGMDSEGNAPPIARVNGRPITRSRVVDLLFRSRGAGLLEQLIGLETAAMAATAKGLTITQADVDREYDLALRRLADPLSSVTPGSLDRDAAERLLEMVLSEGNMSREEFSIIMRRNAYLRRIVESEQTFTEEQLRREFQRAYGKRVQVRHIQLATLGEVGRVKERLAAGEGFGELASRHSANIASAQEQGLLAPFSAEDERVPALFREVAFALTPGEVSSAVRVGEWYHLIKLEKVLSAEDRQFDRVRGELEHSLRERAAEQAMYELFEKLFREANIEIYDPVLKQAFDDKHPGRAR